MARDGLFFRSVGHVTEHTHVPVAAIILQSVWTMVIALSGRYEQILNYVVSMDFIFFGLTGATVFVFRRRQTRRQAGGEAGVESAYRVPGHPFTTGLFVLICWLVVGNTVYKYPENTLVGMAILLLGVPVFWLWARRQSRRSDRRE
jgi:APA family basic amino acid/polyamine antiporter